MIETVCVMKIKWWRSNCSQSKEKVISSWKSASKSTDMQLLPLSQAKKKSFWWCVLCVNFRNATGVTIATLLLRATFKQPATFVLAHAFLPTILVERDNRGLFGRLKTDICGKILHKKGVNICVLVTCYMSQPNGSLFMCILCWKTS